MTEIDVAHFLNYRLATVTIPPSVTTIHPSHFQRRQSARSSSIRRISSSMTDSYYSMHPENYSSTRYSTRQHSPG
jgi:hypothetical protein